MLVFKVICLTPPPTCCYFYVFFVVHVLNSIAVSLDVCAFLLMSPEIGGKFEPADSIPQWLSK